MIIDLILDRKDAEEAGHHSYSARDFYWDVLQYRGTFPKLSDPITRAMDYGDECDVRAALCEYIINNDYNRDICNYICSVNWL